MISALLYAYKDSKDNSVFIKIYEYFDNYIDKYLKKIFYFKNIDSFSCDTENYKGECFFNLLKVIDKYEYASKVSLFRLICLSIKQTISKLMQQDIKKEQFFKEFCSLNVRYSKNSFEINDKGIINKKLKKHKPIINDIVTLIDKGFSCNTIRSTLVLLGYTKYYINNFFHLIKNIEYNQLDYS